MENIVIGSIVFEFIGTLIKWCFLYLIRRFKGKKMITFKEVWSGKGKDFTEGLETGVSNIFLGMLFVIMVILVLTLTIT